MWPTNGHISYVTTTLWGVPGASKKGGKSQVAHEWADYGNKCYDNVPLMTCTTPPASEFPNPFANSCLRIWVPLK